MFWFIICVVIVILSVAVHTGQRDQYEKRYAVLSKAHTQTTDLLTKRQQERDNAFVGAERVLKERDELIANLRSLISSDAPNEAVVEQLRWMLTEEGSGHRP